jgi:hypothetical protein
MIKLENMVEKLHVLNAVELIITEKSPVNAVNKYLYQKKNKHVCETVNEIS